MKKFICLVVVMVMTICSSVVYAVEPDSEVISLSDINSFTSSKKLL